jgi:hypothetical protein
LGQIIKELEIKGYKRLEGKEGKHWMGKKMKVLFDSGAGESVMHEDKAKQFCEIDPLPEPKKFKVVDGHTIEATGSGHFYLEISTKAGSVALDGLVYTSRNFDLGKEVDMIIGAPLLQKNRIILKFDPERGKSDLDLSEALGRIEYLF